MSSFLKTLTCILLIALSFSAKSQTEPENTTEASIEDLVKTGNRLLAQGYFSSSARVWEQVVDAQPGNANAQFKLGLSYRNSLDHHEDALEAFKVASTGLTPDYDFGSPEEQNAPFDALFFLGESYLINDQPDSALEQFIQYQGQFASSPPIAVDRHILMCINAKRLKKTVRDVNLNDAGTSVNSAFAETNPVVTLDNNLMFFSTRRLRESESNKDDGDKVFGQYHEDIYVSNKQGTAWQPAAIFPLSDKADEAPMAISKDGLTLYYRTNAKGNDDILESRYEGGVWRKAKSPDAKINTKANESGFSISEDGNHIFFISDREDGQGGFDIYEVSKKSNGKWDRPVNLGRQINSPQDEVCVFIHPTGNTLFWSSDGYLGKGMGGFDIYYSERQEDGTWGEPQNMGYPINSTSDDLFYYIGGSGMRYYSRHSDESSYDIYSISGGGYEFENLEIGTEVVTLTQEMEVAEILEVEKEVQTEVEVLDLSILDDFETEPEETVEEIDLTSLGEEEEPMDSLAADSAEVMEDEMVEEESEEEALEEEEEDTFIEVDMESIVLDSMSPEDRDELINRVTVWMRESTPENTVTNSGTIYFAPSSRRVTTESRETLAPIATTLKENSGKKAVITGHTDESGNWTTNSRISRERAWEVYKYFRNQGIPSSQLIWVGKGSTEPAASNAIEEGRRQNRRVEVSLIDQD